ncbi:MAG: phosphatase PAP2 family protein [Treponema sp.]|nr:phosphatase PAP2 family protein [Treponema sp.]
MKKYLNTILYAILFVSFTQIVNLFDVQAIGPQGSTVGLAGLNSAVHNFFGMHLFWYKLTEVFGILAILVAAFFAVVGFIQLIKRKSLLKVDKNILMLGVIYILVILLYVLFERFSINYRPVILDEGLEPSYPSTHTMLILTILGTAAYISGAYIKNTKLLIAARIACFVIMALTIIGRMICGVHWFTDILGGILISVFLISLYKDLVSVKKEEK